MKLTEGRQPGHEEPVLYLRMHIALLHVNDGEPDKAKPEHVTLTPEPLTLNPQP